MKNETTNLCEALACTAFVALLGVMTFFLLAM
jgi:hypothetical protein